MSSFDLDFPVECDDEYWESDDPQLAFKQPPGKPSTVSYFNCLLRVMRIHAYALRSMVNLYETFLLFSLLSCEKYSLRSSKLLSDRQHAQEIVSELDSELNKWLDSVPEHRTSPLPLRLHPPLTVSCS